jgi:hypothetical protein
MKTVAAFFALGALLASPCSAEIQWALHPSVHSIDGHTAPYVTAMLGANEIRYVPPTMWTLSGSRFIPPGKIEADAYFDTAQIQAPAPWTPDRVKAFHDTVLSRMIPKGAANAAILSEGPLAQSAGQSCEICFSYDAYGSQFVESIVILEHGNTQFQIHFGCLKADFPDLHAAFVGSLFTLRGF